MPAWVRPIIGVLFLAALAGAAGPPAASAVTLTTGIDRELRAVIDPMM